MSLALYRTYRPGALAEVVGQDHVVAPLRRALANGRIHHAYLLSGPRGCGKTSTARILARSLNCAQGPTPDPCGSCDSCIGLAPNGPGTQDVVELDAASHGGVDDTRNLREQAVFSPASSRYRIYIIDEAHMVTAQGFNALLKVVEEPPPHVRFIFATTEPGKVLGTIRSRTFHYSFRLVPTAVLAAHLADICTREQVGFEEPALRLVAEAAGGSVRDGLSLLGQLIAGATEAGLDFDGVRTSLGVTDLALLDRTVAAIAHREPAEAFEIIADVVGSGHDARRFLTDLLDRFRDLIIARQVPAEELANLLDVPADHVAGLVQQSERFGPGELSRAADLINDGISALKGATAPRLQLELLMARILLPAADDSTAGLQARLDSVERRVVAGAAAGPVSPEPTRSAAPDRRPTHARPQSAPTTVQGPTGAESSASRAQIDPNSEATGDRQQPAVGGAEPTRQRGGDAGRAGAGSPGSPPPRLSTLAPATARPADDSTVVPPTGRDQGPTRSETPSRESIGVEQHLDRDAPEDSDDGAGPALAAEAAHRRQPRSSADTAQATPSHDAPSQGVASQGAASATAEQSRLLAEVASAWPAVLSEVSARSKVTWTTLKDSTPVALDERDLTVAIASAGQAQNFRKSRRDELLRQVVIDMLRLDRRVVVTVSGASDAPVLSGHSTSGATPSPGPQTQSEADQDEGAAVDDPDLQDSDLDPVDLVKAELGAVQIGEIGNG